MDEKGLRPTPDRVRETLFNWLTLDLPSAHVLDCFSGAGGLGLEAASRYAKSVTLVELDATAANNLRYQCGRLQADHVQVIQGDVLQYLDTARDRFDIVFIDPPYDQPELRELVLDKLIQSKLLNPQAKIYLEWPQSQQMELKYPQLQWNRQKTAASVCYAIAQYNVSG